jgi:hypothetical protein
VGLEAVEEGGVLERLDLLVNHLNSELRGMRQRGLRASSRRSG